MYCMHSNTSRGRASCSFKTEQVESEQKGRENLYSQMWNIKLVVLKNSQCAVTSAEHREQERERKERGGKIGHLTKAYLTHSCRGGRWQFVPFCPVAETPNLASQPGCVGHSALLSSSILISVFLHPVALLSLHCCVVCQTFKRLSRQK